MVLFGKKKKKLPAIKRYKITYQAKGEPIRYVIVHAINTDKALVDFYRYYGSPGDEIVEICQEPHSEPVA